MQRVVKWGGRGTLDRIVTCSLDDQIGEGPVGQDQAGYFLVGGTEAFQLPLLQAAATDFLELIRRAERISSDTIKKELADCSIRGRFLNCVPIGALVDNHGTNHIKLNVH